MTPAEIRNALLAARLTTLPGVTYDLPDGTSVEIRITRPTFGELLAGGEPLELVARHAVTNDHERVFASADDVDRTAPASLVAALLEAVEKAYREEANPPTPRGGSSTPRGDSG